MDGVVSVAPEAARHLHLGGAARSARRGHIAQRVDYGQGDTDTQDRGEYQEGCNKTRSGRGRNRIVGMLLHLHFMLQKGWFVYCKPR